MSQKAVLLEGKGARMIVAQHKDPAKGWSWMIQREHVAGILADLMGASGYSSAEQAEEMGKMHAAELGAALLSLSKG